MIIKLAMRNVFRNRRRSLITMIAIACGIFSLVLIKGLTDGYGMQAQKNLMDLEYGHLQVFNAGYYENETAGLKETMDRPDQVLAELKKISAVSAATERLVVPSLVNYLGDEMPCLAVGIDPAGDEKVFKLRPQLIEGRYLASGAEAMIGDRMAKTLAVKIGDQVVWKARALGEGDTGPIQALSLTVTGIFSTGDPGPDGSMIFMPLGFMQEGLQASSRASQVVIRLQDPDRLAEAWTAVNSALAPLGYETKTWKVLAKDFFDLYRLDKLGNMITVYILLLIIMVGIVNTMLMATYERVREIGMLMALGMKKREVRLLFLAEGAFLGLWGSLLGIAVGAPLTWLLEIYGMPIAWFTGGQDVDFGYPIRGAMYADLSLPLVLYAVAFGILLSTLASLWPAYRGSRLKPTEALRHV